MCSLGPGKSFLSIPLLNTLTILSVLLVGHFISMSVCVGKDNCQHVSDVLFIFIDRKTQWVTTAASSIYGFS